MMETNVHPSHAGGNREQRYTMRDWGRHIRLSGRRIKATCVPQIGVIEDVCQTTFNNFHEQRESRFTIWRKHDTNFVVKEPPRDDRINASQRLHNELQIGVQCGDVKLPPQVVGVREDALADIERKLLEPLPVLQ